MTLRLIKVKIPTADGDGASTDGSGRGHARARKYCAPGPTAWLRRRNRDELTSNFLSIDWLMGFQHALSRM